MRLLDNRSETTVANGLLATLAGATPAKGNIVDTVDHARALFALVSADVTAAGDEGIAFEFQHSDTTADADFEAVAADDLLGDVADLANGALGSVGYIGNRRYVRVIATGSANTDATVAGAWMLQKPRYMPAAPAVVDIAAT